tara:strand:+ start:1152 stop:1379 length:228 start_codon:yes stop_codon:yes gene_type:complete
MKNLITVVTFVICLACCFYLDKIIVNSIVDAVPKSADEWKALITIGLWIFVGGSTFTIALSISGIIAKVAHSMFE